MKFLTHVPEFLKTQNNWYHQEKFKEKNPSQTICPPINQQVGLFSPQFLNNQKYLLNIKKVNSNKKKMQEVGVIRTNNEIIEVS